MDHTYKATTVENDSAGFEDLQSQLLTQKSGKTEETQQNQPATERKSWITWDDCGFFNF